MLDEAWALTVQPGMGRFLLMLMALTAALAINTATVQCWHDLKPADYRGGHSVHNGHCACMFLTLQTACARCLLTVTYGRSETSCRT